jgi:acyl-coenzyme A thioesterase PaaI-like protein
MGSPEMGEAFLKAVISIGNNFDTTVLGGKLREIKASEGRVTALLRVDDRLKNRWNTLHGGCTGAKFLRPHA